MTHILAALAGLAAGVVVGVVAALSTVFHWERTTFVDDEPDIRDHMDGLGMVPDAVLEEALRFWLPEGWRDGWVSVATGPVEPR